MNSSVLVSTSVKSDEDRHRGNRSKSLVRQGSVPLDSYYIPISPRTNHSESLVRQGPVPLDSYYVPISPRTNHSESLVRR